MLRDNLKALHHAFVLMDKDAKNKDDFTRDDTQEALRAFCFDDKQKQRKAQAKFSPGTSQNTLLRNRLEALHIAEARIKIELDKR